MYVWKTHIDMSKMPSRRDRNEFYESFSSKYPYTVVYYKYVSYGLRIYAMGTSRVYSGTSPLRTPLVTTQSVLVTLLQR